MGRCGHRMVGRCWRGAGSSRQLLLAVGTRAGSRLPPAAVRSPQVPGYYELIRLVKRGGSSCREEQSPGHKRGWGQCAAWRQRGQPVAAALPRQAPRWPPLRQHSPAPASGSKVDQYHCPQALSARLEPASARSDSARRGGRLLMLPSNQSHGCKVSTGRPRAGPVRGQACFG